MFSYLVEGKTGIWFFETTHEDKAQIIAEEVLSNESVLLNNQPCMSFFKNGIGFCKAMRKSLEEASKMIEKKQVRVISLKKPGRK